LDIATFSVIRAFLIAETIDSIAFSVFRLPFSVFLFPFSFFRLPSRRYIRYIRYIRGANPLPNFLLPSAISLPRKFLEIVTIH
jgi:hypothetical protein